MHPHSLSSPFSREQSPTLPLGGGQECGVEKGLQGLPVSQADFNTSSYFSFLLCPHFQRYLLPPIPEPLEDSALYQVGSSFFSFFNKFIYLFIYFWLRWVFVAARGLSLVAASGGYSLLRCTDFSLRWLLLLCLLQSTGSRHVGFSSCGARA